MCIIHTVIKILIKLKCYLHRWICRTCSSLSNGSIAASTDVNVERNVEKKIKSISVFIQIPHYTLYLLHYNALKNIIFEVKILQP